MPLWLGVFSSTFDIWSSIVLWVSMWAEHRSGVYHFQIVPWTLSHSFFCVLPFSLKSRSTEWSRTTHWRWQKDCEELKLLLSNLSHWTKHSFWLLCMREINFFILLSLWMLESLWCSGFSSVQFSCSVMSDSLWPHELQHTRPSCPSPTPRVDTNPCPSSQWCHPAISSSVVLFSSCPNLSQHQGLFQWVNSSHEVTKVLELQL